MALNRIDTSSGNNTIPKYQQETYLCENCDWSFLIPDEIQVDLCPHCCGTNLHEESDEGQIQAQRGPFELLLPFKLVNSQLPPYLDGFTKGIPFPPKDLNSPNLMARIQRIFLPMWLVDTKVRAKWWAEAGFDYQVVSHQEQYDDHRRGWTTREVNEERIRWEPRLGFLNREFNNISIPALEEQDNITNEIGTYHLDQARNIHANNVSNTIVCWPNRNKEDVWVDAQPAIQLAAGEECRRASKADHIREFTWDPKFDNTNWTLALLPLYATYYLDDDNEYQPIYINGQTGRTSGKKQASMKAARRLSLILLIIALVIFIMSLVVSAGSIALPLLLTLGIVGFVLAIVIGIGAVVPIVIAWQFNRNHKSKTIGFFD